MNFITAIFGAIAQVFGFVNKRTDLKNSPAVVDAAIRADEQKQIDQIRKNIATGNIDASRKDIAE
jgi:hypothetical protein